jgi:hypothetical protein
MTFRTFVYEIRDLYPPEKSRLGMWGFNASLDPEFALKALKHPIRQQAVEDLQGEGREIIQRYGLENNLTEGIRIIENPFSLFNKSWLVDSFRVPGNSCDLALTDSSRSDLEVLEERHSTGTISSMEYMPHNIDSEQQAHCITSMFLYWANFTNLILQGS